MTTPKPKEQPKDTGAVTTAAEAAKLVKREVVALDKDGKPVSKQIVVKGEEVIAFKDYGDFVVVVTNGGEKLRGEKK